MTDPVRFRQLLINLVGNAIKFTYSGVIVSKREMVDGGVKLAIDVVDSGIGMSKEIGQDLPAVRSG